MKEVAYIHAEGMPGGFLKHGTLAMIDDGVFSIVFVPPPEDKMLYESTLHSIEEIRARSGFVLGIHFTQQGKNQNLYSEELILPNVPPLTAPLFSWSLASCLHILLPPPLSVISINPDLLPNPLPLPEEFPIFYCQISRRSVTLSPPYFFTLMRFIYV